MHASNKHHQIAAPLEDRLEWLKRYHDTTSLIREEKAENIRPRVRYRC
jgi:hypothetical protein